MALAEQEFRTTVSQREQESNSFVYTFTVGGTARNADTVLSDAIQYIKEHGWIQGEMKNNEGACLVGALHADGSVYVEVYSRIIKEIGTIDTDPDDGVREMFNAVSEWNDTPGRTVDEVLEVLENAIV